jgi:hypothetical protein
MKVLKYAVRSLLMIKDGGGRMRVCVGKCVRSGIVAQKTQTLAN